MSEGTEFREYGVEEYVPKEHRHISFIDMVAIWVGANANTASWYIGGVIAALGFGGAVVVALIANPIAYLFLALVGFMGFKVATTSMGLARVPFGIVGSKLPSLFNATQFIGWCAVNTFIAAISMSFLLQQLFQWPAYGEVGSEWVLALGVLVNSIITLIVVVVGGTHSIKYAERIAVIGLAILSIWVTVAVLISFPIAEIVAWRPSQDIALPLGVAISVMMAFSLSWVPAVAEFTRYTKTKAASTLAPMIGANISIFWFALVGALGVIAVALSTGIFDPDFSDPSSVAGALGLGWVAFLVLILTTVSTNMINIYAGSMSVVNIFPRLKPIFTLWIMSVFATLISLVPIVSGGFLYAFMGFLDYLGAVFPPLVAIMVTDYYIIRKGQYQPDQIGKKGGPYWYSNGVNWYGVSSWVVGAVSFFIWSQITFVQNTFGAVVLTFVFTGFTYWIFAKIGVSRNAYKDLSVSVDVKKVQ